MKLDISEMKPFKISELFEVELSKGDIKLDDMDAGDIPLVSSGETNNGIVGHIDKNGDGKAEIFPANRLTVDMFCNAFYQDTPFYAVSHGRVNILNPKFEMTKNTGLFIATAIKQEQYKYSYGRAVYSNVAADMDIKLPADDDGNPDWKFMEDYIKSLHHKPLTTKNKVGQVPELNITDWKEFRVGDFFDIHPTKAIEGVSADDCVGVGAPLIVNSAENNGVAGLCDMLPTEDGGIITFSDTTDGNTFFYQPNPFIGFAHVQGMYPKTRVWTESELLFVCTMLMFDARGRYNYGRKMRRDTIAEVMLKLPVDTDGNPDWQFMENYIKSLPYGDRLEG